jgi:hypothetical protein
VLDLFGVTSASFTGEQQKSRQEQINIFNDPKNFDASKLQVILVSGVGQEGLNILDTTVIFVLEPHRVQKME